MDKYCLIYLVKLRRTNQKLANARKPIAALELLSALGAIGRRFEYCRPDHLKPIDTGDLLDWLFY